MKKKICTGNFCKTTYFNVTGVAEYLVGVKDGGKDEVVVYYEDGLYKLYKNGIMVMAATGVLIRVVDYTMLNK